MTDTSTRPEPERDRWGRYKIIPAAGGKPRAYTRATTIADTLDDRHNLENWLQRMAMLGLVVRPSLYAEVASLKPEERDKLNDVAKRAREAAKSTAGQETGTALHRFVERINHGEDVRVPAPWDADIAAYQATIAAQGLVVNRQYLERVVVLEELGVAGTFDLLTIQGSNPWRVTDLKTAADLSWSWCAIAVQLAIYAHADTMYDLATQRHEAMPTVDQDVALVIHLPAGQATCTLYEVDIAAGWEAAQHCMWARDWRKRKSILAHPVVTWGEKPKTPRTFGDELRARTPQETKAVAPADPAKVTALKVRFHNLDGDRKAWIDYITAEGFAAGFRFDLNDSSSLAAYLRGLALVRFATLDPDDRLLRGALEHVVGDVLPVIPLGAILGDLTIAQAEALNDLAVAINDGKWTVAYSDDSAQLTAA